MPGIGSDRPDLTARWRVEIVMGVTKVFAFLLGVVNLFLHALSDTLREQGWCLRACEAVHHGIPWSILLVSAILIAPMTLGARRTERLITEFIALRRMHARRLAQQAQGSHGAIRHAAHGEGEEA